MAVEFKFPDIGEGLTEGEIVRWLVKEGEEVKEGQPLVEVETDKALAEIPSPRSGVVLRILAKEKEIVKVGQVIVVYGEKGEAIAAPVPEKAPPEKAVSGWAVPPPRPKSVGVVGELEEAPEEVPVVETKPAEPGTPIPVGGHALATPVIRALAKELGVDINRVKGTGPEGRVLEKDIRQAVEKKEVSPGPEKKIAKVKKYDLYGYIDRIPLRGVRRSIAKAMVKSVHTATHVTAIDEADVTDLWAIKEKEKKAAEKKGIKLTLLPFIVKAVIAGLEAHPYLNATLDDENEEILLKKYYNIGFATDTPEGLMVPVVKNAKDKSILQLAEEVAQLAEKARARKIDLPTSRGGRLRSRITGPSGEFMELPSSTIPKWPFLGSARRERFLP